MQITLRKVMAHAEQCDVDQGRITPKDYYVGNRFADRIANKIAEPLRDPDQFEKELRQIKGRTKAIIRRLVAINVHCVEKFPQRKAKREKVVRPSGTQLVDLIRASQHHLYAEGGRWKCHHCHLNLSTQGLTKQLRRNLACAPPAENLEGVIANLADRPRLDQPARMRAMRTLTLEGRTSHETQTCLLQGNLHVLHVRASSLAGDLIQNGGRMQRRTSNPLRTAK